MTSMEFSLRFNELADLMFGFAMKLTKNREEAKDLLQETATRAFGNLKRFKKGTNFKAWISTIMHHSFVNHYRRKKTREVGADTVKVQFYGQGNKSTFANAHSKIMMKELMSLVNGLAVDYKDPFLMHYEGYSYKEISKKLGLRMGTVKSRIFYARQRLQEKILERYGDAVLHRT